VQLLLTDPYGHVNAAIPLSLAECQSLSEALDALRPIEVIDVTAEVVEEDEPEEETEEETEEDDEYGVK
jgi:hypothetical protein